MSAPQDSSPHSNLGISGRIARAFLTTEITPLLALTGLLLGIFCSADYTARRRAAN